ncbi:MAG: hypothetical protein H6851_06415 [Geminicoccaceae bacterium]|nr:hypothetical protein [Geminicoccaceae bacterium]
MRKAAPLIGLAAFASAVLFLSIPLGVGRISLVAYFVQLPLLYVGFTLGLTGFSVGSLAASLIVLLVAGGMAAGIFVAMDVVPGFIVIRHALLWRPAGDGSREWFPSGLILGRLAIYMLVLLIVVLGWLQFRFGDLADNFSAGMDILAADYAGNAMAAQVIGIYRGLVPVLPGIAAAGLFLVSVANGAMAFKLAQGQQRSVRPNELLRLFRLPGWFMPAFLVTIAAAMVLNGNPGFYARGVAIVLGTGYLLLGLALVHSLMARVLTDTFRRVTGLTVFYVVFVLFGLIAVPVVAAMGLIEDRAQMRHTMS